LPGRRRTFPYELGEGIPGGVIRKGTVGGQQYAWTAWVDGAPFMTYRTLWTMGEHVEPRWDTSESCYRIVIDGDPPLEMKLLGGVEADGGRLFHGLPWTGLLCATAVPAVCEAPPGLLTHLDLGVIKPQGLVRR
jgi:2,4-diaminopentanoate dehydrogenase